MLLGQAHLHPTALLLVTNQHPTSVHPTHPHSSHCATETGKVFPLCRLNRIMIYSDVSYIYTRGCKLKCRYHMHKVMCKRKTAAQNLMAHKRQAQCWEHHETGQDLGEQQHRGTSAHFQAAALMYKSVVTQTTNFPREITLN